MHRRVTPPPPPPPHTHLQARADVDARRTRLAKLRGTPGIREERVAEAERDLSAAQQGAEAAKAAYEVSAAPALSLVVFRFAAEGAAGIREKSRQLQTAGSRAQSQARPPACCRRQACLTHACPSPPPTLCRPSCSRWVPSWTGSRGSVPARWATCCATLRWCRHACQGTPRASGPRWSQGWRRRRQAAAMAAPLPAEPTPQRRHQGSSPGPPDGPLHSPHKLCTHPRPLVPSSLYPRMRRLPVTSFRPGVVFKESNKEGAQVQYRGVHSLGGAAGGRAHGLASRMCR